MRKLLLQIIWIIQILAIQKKLQTFSKVSCAFSGFCGDGYCCNYSSGCFCSQGACRQFCTHGDSVSSEYSPKRQVPNIHADVDSNGDTIHYVVSPIDELNETSSHSLIQDNNRDFGYDNSHFVQPTMGPTETIYMISPDDHIDEFKQKKTKNLRFTSNHNFRLNGIPNQYNNVKIFQKKHPARVFIKNQ